jgi:drug/metabolite transporter (DMT)-like permease
VSTPTKVSGAEAEPAGILLPKRRLRADLTLLLVAVIWGSAFVAQRVAALHMDIYLYNGARFLLGALVLLPFAWKYNSSDRPAAKTGRLGWPGILLAGILLFAGAAFQGLGLRYTTAANAGFITGLYVVLVPLLLALFWRQKPRPRIVMTAGLAAIGLLLLSTGGRFQLAPGDGMEFIGAIMWALHVILIGFLVKQAAVLHIAIGQNLVCAVLSLLVAFSQAGPETWTRFASAWWTVVYTGVFSIGIGYTFQVVGQRDAPPADASVLLSMEAVFAVVFGWLLLDERLLPVQIAGCVLMIVAMLLAQLGVGENSRQVGEQVRIT